MLDLKKFFAILFVLLFIPWQTASAIERKRTYEQKPAYVQGEILVMFMSGVPRERIDDINRMLGTSVLKSSGRLYVIRVPRTESVESMVQKYNAMPGVDYAEPNYIYTVQE